MNHHGTRVTNIILFRAEIFLRWRASGRSQNDRAERHQLSRVLDHWPGETASIANSIARKRSRVSVDLTSRRTMTGIFVCGNGDSVSRSLDDNNVPIRGKLLSERSSKRRRGLSLTAICVAQMELRNAIPAG